jgi:GT2 family glycosyltransferase
VRGEFARGARTAIIERILKVPAISIQSSRATEVDWVTGASVMFRSEALREVGLFDEGFFLYHEEVELMWRLRRAGWEIATEPRSRVRHIGGAATRVRWSDASEMKQPRWPAYMYRSRTRFFALTRGRLRAALSYLAWLAGHAIFRARVALGLGRGAKMVDHELLDHLSKAFPRKHDSIRAVQSLDGSPTKLPAWMERKWL